MEKRRRIRSFVSAGIWSFAANEKMRFFRGVCLYIGEKTKKNGENQWISAANKSEDRGL